MMTYADPPSDVRPEKERRRAARFRPGPLRVRLHRTCEGILVDISETGALVRLPASQPPLKPITLQIEWQDSVLPLPGRVVRSSPHQLELENATIVRPAYHVAIEFSELSENAATLLKHIARKD